MAIDRIELGAPLNVGVIDFNGSGAFAHYGYVVRDYPGLVPSVDTAIAFAGDPLVLRPWQNELHFHAELVAVIGRDVAVGEGESAKDALLGYGLGLGIWDDAPVADLRNKVARDVGVNRAYSYLIEGSRQQGKTILISEELPALDDIELILDVPGHPVASYHQKDLILDGTRILTECSKLVGFRWGDVICLGPTDAPVVASAQGRFPPGSVIRVEGAPFPPLEIPVFDRRDPENAPPWPGCEVDFVARFPHLRPTGDQTGFKNLSGLLAYEGFELRR